MFLNIVHDVFFRNDAAEAYVGPACPADLNGVSATAITKVLSNIVSYKHSFQTSAIILFCYDGYA